MSVHKVNFFMVYHKAVLWGPPCFWSQFSTFIKHRLTLKWINILNSVCVTSYIIKGDCFCTINFSREMVFVAKQMEQLNRMRDLPRVLTMLEPSLNTFLALKPGFQQIFATCVQNCNFMRTRLWSIAFTLSYWLRYITYWKKSTDWIYCYL